MDAGLDAKRPDSSAGCVIGGASYASGAANPTNPCQSCQPSVAPTVWSPVTDGTSCGSGGICHTGTCVSGCEIGGVYYVANAPDPNDPCQTCQPGTKTSTWSSIADGTSCGNSQVCKGGSCGTQCDIDGTVYLSGITNPSNACQSCQPGTSTTTWTSLANGTTCGTGEVCNNTTCSSGCSIDGVVYASGVANPSNACESCQPSLTSLAWSNVTDGTSCGSAEICRTGACVSGCEIQGVYYAASAANPSNACQSCQPSVVVSKWSPVTDGTSCGSGAILSRRRVRLLQPDRLSRRPRLRRRRVHHELLGPRAVQRRMLQRRHL